MMESNQHNSIGVIESGFQIVFFYTIKGDNIPHNWAEYPLKVCSMLSY
jgi:hypothetical protein